MPISSQRASTFGSFCGKLAFMGKLVLGKLTVVFRSSGTLGGSPKWLIFHYRERGKRRPFTTRFSTEVLGQAGLGNALSKNQKKSVQFLPEGIFGASNRLKSQK